MHLGLKDEERFATAPRGWGLLMHLGLKDDGRFRDGSVSVGAGS